MRRRNRLNAVLGMITALAIAIGLLVGVRQAYAAVPAQQSKCAPQSIMHDRLLRNYEEEPKRVGVMSNGNILELWAGLSGSFTILVTSPQKFSCIVADGLDWTKARRQLPGPDS